MQKSTISSFLSTFVAILVGLPIAATIMPRNAPVAAHDSGSTVSSACVAPESGEGEVLGTAFTPATPGSSLINVQTRDLVHFRDVVHISDVVDITTGDIASNNDINVEVLSNNNILSGNTLGDGSNLVDLGAVEDGIGSVLALAGN